MDGPHEKSTRGHDQCQELREAAKKEVCKALPYIWDEILDDRQKELVLENLISYQLRAKL